MLILEIVIAILLATIIESLFTKPAKPESQISTDELRTTIISAMLSVDQTRKECAELEAASIRFMHAYDNRASDPEEWKRVIADEEKRRMTDVKKQVVERACSGDNIAHQDPGKKNRHTDGHCVPCCDAIRDFGKGSTVAETLEHEHVRTLNTVPQRERGNI